METAGATSVVEDKIKRLTTRPLPMLPHTHNLIKSKLRKSPQMPLTELNKWVLLDPVLCFHLMHEAKARAQSKNAEIKILSHAISMLGFDAIQDIVETYPLLSKEELRRSYTYLKIIGRSVHAAMQAQTWAELKNHAIPEEMYWSSLLHQSPLWSLAYLEPEIAKRLGQEHISEQEQINLLGAPIVDLSSRIAHHWELPHLVQQCWQSEHRPTNKDLAQLIKLVQKEEVFTPSDDKHQMLLLNSPKFSVLLSQWLSHAAGYDWYSRQTHRLLKLVSLHIKQPLDQTVNLTHKMGIAAARRYPIPAFATSMARLVQYGDLITPEKPTVAKKPAPQTVKEPVSKPLPPMEKKGKAETELDQTTTTEEQAALPETPESTNITASPELPEKKEKAALGMINTAPTPKETRGPKPDMLKEFATTMLTKTDEFQDIHELMNLAVQGVRYGVDLDRVVAGFLNQDRSEIQAYYSAGTLDYPDLGEFHVNIKFGDLFHQLIQKPSTLWVNKQNKAKIWTKIPGSFKQATRAEEFIITSVFIRQKPVAIIYADNGATNRRIRESDYQAFKYLCAAANKGMEMVSNRQR